MSFPSKHKQINRKTNKNRLSDSPSLVWEGNPIHVRFLWGPLPHGFKRAGQAEAATQMRTDLEPEAEDPLGGEQDTTARPTKKKLADLRKGRKRRSVLFVLFLLLMKVGE